METEIERRKSDRRNRRDRRTEDRGESFDLKNRQEVLEQEISLAQNGNREADTEKVLALLLL
ncbi:MAG: hypothetical protein AB7U45_00430 [Desulfamplus sp.]